MRRITLVALTVCCLASLLAAQGQPARFKDTSLAPEERAAALVSQMTLEEKASQMANYSRAIPRLGIPAYNWWSEALHGVITDGITEFPEPVGLAATFNTASINEMSKAIGIEGRIKFNRNLAKKGHTDIFEGIDFWSPNVNIFRDPRWGRGQETYGEDPFLSARMAVAYVTGLQGNDPRYYQAISTPKHYAVHSGPEPSRHRDNFDISKHDQIDTYLPAFRAAIVEAKAGSIMCAYNSINGEPACASKFLLEDQLRGKWGFKGYVVSDCDAVTNIWRDHHFSKTRPEGNAISVQRGMDNECNSFGIVKDDNDYRDYVAAVKQGFLKESELDTALIRTFAARIRLGMFDPPEMVPYSKVDEKQLDSAEHRALALKLANQSMVLLKNDGVLPLKTGKKVLVVGPLAEQTRVLLGNYAGKPTKTVTILEGMDAEFGKQNVTFAPGTMFLEKKTTTVGPEGFSSAPLKVTYTYAGEDGKDFTVDGGTTNTVDASKLPALKEQPKGKLVSVKWTGKLGGSVAGDYSIGIKCIGDGTVHINGKPAAFTPYWDPSAMRLGKAHIEPGKPVDFEANYKLSEKETKLQAELIWTVPDPQREQKAIAAAKKADVVVAVVGITSELEGEEMPVNEPGFLGGDRTSIDLPKAEQDLVKALAATGKPLVVVLTNGSALAVNEETKLANAVLDAFYPGEEGGNAVAQTLSGRNNPAGRLPVTFYTGVNQLPPFENYAMKGRTYRYFEGKPLFPFGYGLSYTTFAYSDLKLAKNAISADEPLTAEVTVKNTGKVEGDEVAQVYISFPNVDGAPIRALRAFKRIHLKPGESQKVSFELKDRDLSMVNAAGDPIIAEGSYQLSIGGGQPNTGAPTVSGTFAVNGTKTLPE